MSRGDELWMGRQLLLRELYQRGAVEGKNIVLKDDLADVVKEADADIDHVVQILRKEGLAKETGDTGQGWFLTVHGFKEARRIVETERAEHLPLDE